MMKPLTLLLLTLFVGMILGAAITGRVVQSRLAKYNNFLSEAGFTQIMMDVIEPESEGQRAKLLPILEETGQHIQETKANARTDILLHYRELEAELLPILSEEQKNRLQSWREKLRVRLDEHPKPENR
ncbi:MAG: hypothetical protein CME01_10850 [Geminicoccus sp.]|nr:hypothetical protein [Geminicoccus sp.]